MKSEVRGLKSERSAELRFSDDGCLILPDALSGEECDALAAELTPMLDEERTSSTRRIGGVRNLLRASSLVAATASLTGFVALLERLTGGKVFPVRAIFFDKTTEANWRVPWHQDLAIAVAERIETPGFGPWSIKAGVIHVQPPLRILRNMVSVRLHLDDCDATNGALRVIPGSHLGGELDADGISEWTQQYAPVVCEVPRGGALVMRPLLLHASSPAESPRHRRVLHLEYASAKLPNGLKWFDQ